MKFVNFRCFVAGSRTHCISETSKVDWFEKTNHGSKQILDQQETARTAVFCSAGIRFGC